MANSETERTDKFQRIGVQSVTAAVLASEFRPVRVLSRGGMGVILLAEEVVTKRLVAIKVLNPESKSLLPLAQQFMREAVITARLQHPNVVPVYRLGFLDGDRRHPHLFFTMKFIEGSSYASVRHTLQLEERLRVLAGVAAALAYAHKRNLWHRDLKPDNVMLGLHDDVYLVDWGLVSIAPGAAYRLELPEIAMLDIVQALPEDIDTLLEETPEAVTVSRDGGPSKVLGTPLYMSPEQASNHRDVMGPPSDVWALGVMLYEALYDLHPFVEDPSASNLEILTNTINARIPRVSRPLPDVSPRIAELCHATLAHDLAARPHASDVLEALRAPRYAPSTRRDPALAPLDRVSLSLPNAKTIVGDRRMRTPLQPASTTRAPGPALVEPSSAGPRGSHPRAASTLDTELEAAGEPAVKRAPLRTDHVEPMVRHDGNTCAERTLTIVSPTGYRIEGVTAEQALSFLKALGA